MHQSAIATDEQLLVAESRAMRTRVDAGAGTGKTTTLAHYARARGGQAGLYLAFNKAIQLEAARRFPGSCRTRTLHSLAFMSYGKAYADARKLVSAVRHASVLHLFNDIVPTRCLLRARLAVAAVHAFTVSAAPEIDLAPAARAEALALGFNPDQVRSDAENLWRAMSDVANRAVGMTHDGYFKQWALSNPQQLGQRLEYLLVDEAQDLNPVANAVLSALDVPIVYVGDSAQSIYAFRGAADCLAEFPAELTLQLTRSFRFGPAIAALANSLLRAYKEIPLTLVGTAPKDAVCAVQEDIPYAVIARTNAGVFTEAAAAVRRQKTVHFVGGPAAYGFGRIRQVSHLFAGAMNLVTDPFLRALGSFSALQEYADLVKDSEVKSVCRVVEQHGADIPSLIGQFEQHCVQEPSRTDGPIEAIYPADVFLTTCHKAKGLEFAQVRLAGDFPSLLKKGALISRQDVDQQEINLLYVAITRAAVILEAPAFMAKLIPPTIPKKPPTSAREPQSDRRPPLRQQQRGNPLAEF